MTLHQTSVTSDRGARPRTSRLSALTLSLRAGYVRASTGIDRVAVRGQLGPSVGRRHDREPERFI